MSEPHDAADRRTAIALEVACTYHDAWTKKNFQEAGCYLAADLETDVPLNTYANAAEFLAGLSGFVQLVTDVDLLAELGDNEEAMLLCDVHVASIGKLCVAGHFSVVDQQITRIRHSTTPLRYAQPASREERDDVAEHRGNHDRAVPGRRSRGHAARPEPAPEQPLAGRSRDRRLGLWHEPRLPPRAVQLLGDELRLAGAGARARAQPSAAVPPVPRPWREVARECRHAGRPRREEMTEGSYEAQVDFTQPPEAVFAALTTVRGLAGWWSPAAGGGAVAGDVLRLDHNGKGTLVLEVDAVERPRFVGWRVRSYTLNEEWAGTEITFQIGPGAEGGTALTFRHDGLVPELDCYDRCSRGWEYFLPSLRDYVETGTGRPLA